MSEEKKHILDKKPIITCPLCGHKFTEGMKTGCFVCPMQYKKCHFEKCPHCGYDIPTVTRFGKWIVGLFDKLYKGRKI